MTSNPLLTKSTLPFELPPFDKIKDEHFQPALEQGITEEEKEADQTLTEIAESSINVEAEEQG